MEWKYYLLKNGKHKLTEAEVLLFNNVKPDEFHLISLTSLGDEIFNPGICFDECLFWKVAQKLEYNKVYIEADEIYLQGIELDMQDIPRYLLYWLENSGMPTTHISQASETDLPGSYSQLFDNFVLN